MMLDFMEDPTNAAFGSNGGMRDDTTIIRPEGLVSLVALHRPLPRVCRVGSVGGFMAKSREEGEKCNGLGM